MSPTPIITDTEALDAIHALLDGKEWDADSIVDVARVVERTGRSIAPPAVVVLAVPPPDTRPCARCGLRTCICEHFIDGGPCEGGEVDGARCLRAAEVVIADGSHVCRTCAKVDPLPREHGIRCPAVTGGDAGDCDCDIDPIVRAEADCDGAP